MKWQLKAALQGVLGRVPYGRRVNLAFQERHGEIRRFDAPRVVGAMVEHFIAPAAEQLGGIDQRRVLEIGTGWLPTLPCLFAALGAEVSTFDIARHLSAERGRNVWDAVQKELPSALSAHGLSLPILRHGAAADGRRPREVLAPLGIQYTAPADTTRLPIASASQDLVISNLTLQHIPPKVLPAVLRELTRVLRPGGIAIHRINLHDEYASVDPSVSSINFLRYPDWFWESFGNNPIKYVNRERYPWYLEQLADSGVECLHLRRREDARALPALRGKPLAARFQKYSASELSTVGIHVLLRKPARDAAADLAAE